MPIAIIQARMSSTRLSGKIMKPLLNKPVLWHVVNRVSKSEFIEKIIVATTVDIKDDIIEEFCKSNNILLFRGAKNDVLDRYYQCAKKYNIEDIVRITADCPLHDPHIIDLVVKEYLKGGYDYVSNTIEYRFPDGLDIEVFSFRALQAAWKNGKLPSEREHVTTCIRKKKEFKKKNVYSKKKYPLYRLTLDYKEDYQFIKKVYAGIGRKMFYLNDIIKFLEANPQLLKINQHFKKNEGYLKSSEADKKYKNENVIINGKRIYLRKLKEEDASQEYCSWVNNPLVNKFLETKKATIKELKQYIREKKENENCLFWGFFSKDTNKHIGNIKFEPIDWNNKKATLGILIGNKNYWGQGICAEVVKLVTKYTFKNLDLEKIDLGVISGNKAAIKCYLKAGFKIDKIKQGAIRDGNRFYDKVFMSVRKRFL